MYLSDRISLRAAAQPSEFRLDEREKHDSFSQWPKGSSRRNTRAQTTAYHANTIDLWWSPLLLRGILR